MLSVLPFPTITPLISPQHFSLPASCLFFNNRLCLVNTVHMLTGVGMSMGAWKTHHGPYPQKIVILSSTATTHYQLLLRTLRSSTLYLCRDLVQVGTDLVRPWLRQIATWQPEDIILQYFSLSSSPSQNDPWSFMWCITHILVKENAPKLAIMAGREVMPMFTK